MLGVELPAASVVRASKLCVAEGKSSIGGGEEPTSEGISASPERGTELGVLERTSESTSSSETNYSVSSSSGT